MSLVGIFMQSRPSIHGEFFDALLEESTELQTDVTEFPIEDGSVGHDHAVVKPLRLTMTVGVSDNPFRVARAKASDPVADPLIGLGAGIGIGGVASRLPGSVAALAGMVVGGANAAGQAARYATTVLDNVRPWQRERTIIEVGSSEGATYQDRMITRTYQQTTKQNEQGLELVVEMQQLQIINQRGLVIVNPPINDPAATQAQPTVDLGRVALQ